VPFAVTKNRVLQSLENATAERCVDIFVRPDGTFGFEEFRRDFEDCGRWQSLNRFSRHVSDSEAHALTMARKYVAWLGMGHL